MDHPAVKNMKRYLPIAALFGAAILTACDKNAVQEITEAPPAASIKFFNFGVNAPSVNFYADDRKVTAISSASGTETTLGVAYGSVGAGGFYSGIQPGQYTLSGKISATIDKDKAISSVTATIADGKFYSYYLSGFYNTAAKTVEAFIIEDPIPAIDYSAANVRFVNAISNSQPMVLSAKNTVTGTVTALGAAVAYKAGGAFTAIPGGSYDLSTRVAGAATDAIIRKAVTFAPGRVYTIGARGDITATTGTPAPFLDNTLNR
jgi:Domain of unknown function (DUF4397)